MKKAILFLLFCSFLNTIQAQTPAFKTYSKFDFISGEKVVFVEDFAQAAIGDFPAKWNTNGSGEIVTLVGQQGKWLKINGKTKVFPEFVNNLPENFTLEFNIVADPAFNYANDNFSLVFTPSTDLKKLFSANFQSRVEASFTPFNKVLGSSNANVYGSDSKQIMSNKARVNFGFPDKPMVKISIWRQASRLRVYVDEAKIWDLPTAFDASSFKKIIFSTTPTLSGQAFYLSGFRLAIGAPDTRNKLITEGKFVTTGILFDSNSDKIKGESYGILKQIAEVLQENMDVKIRIIGHTDSDGDDAKNLDLSKRRAISVKNNLVNEFGIDASRFQTDGKGETQPMAPNSSPEGKANNRRVEFVKL